MPGRITTTTKGTLEGKEARRVDGGVEEEEGTSFSLTLISAADFLHCCRGGYCLFGRKTPCSTWFCPLFSSSTHVAGIKFLLIVR